MRSVLVEFDLDEDEEVGEDHDENRAEIGEAHYEQVASHYLHLLVL